jgi:hypothetical protein
VLHFEGFKKEVQINLKVSIKSNTDYSGNREQQQKNQQNQKVGSLEKNQN